MSGKTFNFTQVWSTGADGNPKAWKRINVADVATYQNTEANNFSCFASVQKYANSKNTNNEEFIQPLVFDLDSPDPAVAQQDAVKLIEFFTKELDTQEADISIYFSGSKGFHILIDPVAVGITPGTELHRVQKHIAGYLKFKLNTETVDLAVYTAPRMLRLPLSIHEKTKLFKTPLTLSELKSLSIDAIKELANGPRMYFPNLGPTAPREKLKEFYKAKAQEYQELKSMEAKKFDKTDYNFIKEKNPACVQDLLDNGWKRSDGRNAATVQLACYFRQAGYDEQEVMDMLVEWVTKHTSAGSKYQVAQRVANTKSVISAIFNSQTKYAFSCAFIRSLHGEKTSKDYDRVKCSGNLCHCIHKDIEETPIELCLDETGNAEYTGKLIKTRVMVVGVKATPYIVPKDIEYQCWGYANCKKLHCPLYDIPNHVGYKNLSCSSRELLQMISVDDDTVKKILSSISGIPSCPKHNVEIEDKVNVTEIAVIPKADETIDNASKYVLRKIYLVRDSQSDIVISDNRYYEITGYVYPHPKNQESTIIIKDAKPLQDMVETFTLTAEVKKQLSAFQAKPTVEDIEAKLNAMLTDISYNVTQIVGRGDVALGVMLTQHSLLRLQVPWDVNPIRGWLELIILGDTGTGKSALVDKLVKFSGLGDTVNAESTSRTGLSYKMEQAGGSGAWYIVWGAFPRADKGFIWIDEATGISKDEYGELTMARSDGKLQVKKAVTSETNCRVRCVVTGNVVKGRRIDDYTYGCKAIKDIFNNEDIRRFDFAMGLKTSDVDAEEYNKLLGSYPRTLTAEAYRNNILFAWSRTTDQVIWANKTVETILDVSVLLSKTFGRVTDVPLVSPSDMRAKVARLSAALAALLNSVDETGEKLVVKPAHVEYIGAYLERIYKSDGLGLEKYAAISQGESKLSDKRFDKLTATMKELIIIRSDKAFQEFLKLFAKQDYFRVNEVENMLSIDKDDAKAIINLLSKNDLIKSTSGGMKKEPLFNQYISKCYDKGILAFAFDEDDE